MRSKEKYWSYVAELKLPDLEKDAVSRIYQANLVSQMSGYNMNRDVQELINTKVIIACLIACEDLAHIIGTNSSSSLMLGLLRNLLSLPRKQGYCSSEQYKEFFRTTFHSKLHEKSHN